MRRAEYDSATGSRRWLSASLLASALLPGWVFAAPSPEPTPTCAKPVYLTIDTGHMGVAPLIQQVLERQHVKATFFLANERTQPVGDKPAGSTLDEHWAPWWKALAQQGHDFGSHTWDHIVYKGDEPAGLRMTPTAGAQTGQRLSLSPAQYCEQIQHSAERFEAMTGQRMRAIFRAPGGKTSPKLLAIAQQCGWQHVPWTPAGFLGDELPSDKFPNDKLLQQALSKVGQGDILLMHLGIWSRQEVWAPAVLEPLIVGLKAKGLCFATLREHPQFRKVGPAPQARP
jgi:peptidoglycan-N-acetylmuramic acid deacetylase